MPKLGCVVLAAVIALAGCSSNRVVPPPVPTEPAASGAGDLAEALLVRIDGMRKSYGPESGAFGRLSATRRGVHTLREVRSDPPHCSSAGHLDDTGPVVRDAPAAVVSFTSGTESITEALISLPEGEAARVFPPRPPAECASYTASVGGNAVAYVTREVKLPPWRDESRASLTTASGGGKNIRIGSVVVRYRNVVMSLLVVGEKVNRQVVVRQAERAYGVLRMVMT